MGEREHTDMREPRRVVDTQELLSSPELRGEMANIIRAEVLDGMQRFYDAMCQDERVGEHKESLTRVLQSHIQRAQAAYVTMVDVAGHESAGKSGKVEGGVWAPQIKVYAREDTGALTSVSEVFAIIAHETVHTVQSVAMFDMGRYLGSEMSSRDRSSSFISVYTQVMEELYEEDKIFKQTTDFFVENREERYRTDDIIERKMMFLWIADALQEYMVDRRAVHSVNRVIEQGGAKKFVGEKDTTPPYSFDYTRPLPDQMEEVSKQNGLRAYTSLHEVLEYYPILFDNESPCFLQDFDELKILLEYVLFFSEDDLSATHTSELNHTLKMLVKEKVRSMSRVKLLTLSVLARKAAGKDAF